MDDAADGCGISLRVPKASHRQQRVLQKPQSLAHPAKQGG